MMVIYFSLMSVTCDWASGDLSKNFYFEGANQFSTGPIGTLLNEPFSTG